MQESVDHEMRKMVRKTLAQVFGFARESLFCEGDVANETGNGRERLELREAQDIGRLIDVSPVAVKNALMGVVGQDDRDFGGAGEPGLRLLQSLVDCRLGNDMKTVGPVAGLNFDSDSEGRPRTQEALSSWAVAPS